jgi:hypothetical protein
MAELHYATSGKMTIKLDGITLGRHIKDPRKNVKDLATHPTKGISMSAVDMNNFTDWGVIELVDQGPGTATMTVSIDSDQIGFFGRASVVIFANGGAKILQQDIASAVHGPVGDAKRTESFHIDNLG